MNSLLAHPFCAKMVSCQPFQGKGGLRDHFLGVLAHNVNFWAILGSFWGLLGQFGPNLERKYSVFDDGLWHRPGALPRPLQRPTPYRAGEQEW